MQATYPFIQPLSTEFYTQEPYSKHPFRRCKIQVLLGVLSQCPEWREFDEKTQIHWTIQIEKSCVNNTVHKAMEENVSQNWDIDVFRRMYSNLIVELAEALDWENNQYLMTKLLTGKIRLGEVGSVSTTDMMPKTDVQRLVEARRMTKIDMKTTSMYECGNCHEHKAHFQEVQVRSADEGKDTYLICCFCQHDWMEKL